MDRRRLSAIAHEGLPHWNPLGDAAHAAIVAFVEPERDGRVLDVGCGRGETLLRVVENSGCSGVGVDASPEALALARAAAARVPAGRVEWFEKEFAPGDFPPLSFDGALCLGATHACGGIAATARALHELMRPGGCAAIADLHAVSPPDPEYLAFLGAAPDDIHELSAQRKAVEDAGFSVAAILEASREDFDRYEDRYAANVERHVAAHPEERDAAAMLQHVRAWRAAYQRWGRSTLGYAAFLLRRRDVPAAPARAPRRR